MNVQQIIDSVIDREAGYVDHPSDKGGPTNWGITQATARAAGYTGLMRDLPRNFAQAIYLREYVSGPGFDKITAVNGDIGAEMVDTGVNCGPGLPGPWLQRCLNVLNGQGAYYADLAVDGAIGPATVGALRSYLAKRGELGVRVLLRMLNSLQGAYYIEIAEKRVQNEDFIFGWFANRVEIK